MLCNIKHKQSRKNTSFLLDKNPKVCYISKYKPQIHNERGKNTMMKIKTNSRGLFQKSLRARTLLVPVRDYHDGRDTLVPDSATIKQMDERKITFKLPGTWRKITINLEDCFPSKIVHLYDCRVKQYDRYVPLELASIEVVRLKDISRELLDAEDTLKVNFRFSNLTSNSWIYVLKRKIKEAN